MPKVEPGALGYYGYRTLSHHWKPISTLASTFRTEGFEAGLAKIHTGINNKYSQFLSLPHYEKGHAIGSIAGGLAGGYSGLKAVSSLNARFGAVSKPFGGQGAFSLEKPLASSEGVAKPLDLDALSRAASTPNRGNLTLAGRSLTKHGAGARPGNSLFPTVKGNTFEINAQAKNIVDDILTSPGGYVQHSYRGRFGNTIEVSAPDGRGIVYDASGKFLFFKE